MGRGPLALAAMLALLAAGGCGSGSDDGSRAPAKRDAPTIRIGTKNFTEQYILGELYRQALVAKGFRVQLKQDIGSSEIIDQALLGGGIDMYPEYVGVLLSELASERMRPRNDTEAYNAAKAFEERRGFTLLKPTPFTDSNALAVKPATAARDRITSVPGLARVRGGARIAAPPEFRTRYEGLVGLRSAYGLRRLRLKPLPIGDQYAALDRGAVDAAAVFTTDGQLANGRYRLLADPRNVFADQHVAPVVSRRLVKAGGAPLASVIDAVSAKLTTKVMREMNAAVQLRGEHPADVASRFLTSAGLK